jgi:hypothetical protein
MTLKYKIKDGYKKICNFFNPKQKWIKKYIEYYSWSDKVELIRDFLFGCIVHFVEDEDAFNWNDWEYHENHKEAGLIIKDCYDYIKNKRPLLEKEIDEISIKAVEGMTFGKNEKGYVKVEKRADYEKFDKKLIELENSMEDQDNKVMADILKVRGFLWV